MHLRDSQGLPGGGTCHKRLKVCRISIDTNNWEFLTERPVREKRSMRGRILNDDPSILWQQMSGAAMLSELSFGWQTRLSTTVFNVCLMIIMTAEQYRFILMGRYMSGIGTIKTRYLFLKVSDRGESCKHRGKASFKDDMKLWQEQFLSVARKCNRRQFHRVLTTITDYLSRRRKPTPRLQDIAT